MSLSYRPEIDGFRALAVTTVVLFHAKIPGFENGFIGVDIFFVISGFLITSIIAREQAGEGFSYGRFVMRRVRRILPALVVVMLACIPFAWWLMLPDPLENFGQSLVATAFSANNILLWLTSGYWDLSSDFKPLLHTWSLGVEEQFYILYPMLLVLALRLPIRACYILMAAMAALSFWLMVRALQTDPAAAFYLLHYRAWQLLIGGIAGLLFLRARWGERPALAAAGLALVLLSLIPLGLPMPVLLGLATLGTALYLLFARAEGLVTWVFTRPPVIFVGLVSYSFYLWHQPVFAFLRVAFFETPGQMAFGLAIVLAFGLSVLSWHFIETPFRSARRIGSGGLWAFVGGGMAVAVIAGMSFHLANGLPQRLGSVAKAEAAGMSIAYNERVRRLLPRDIPAGVGDRPVVLITGNSFARDFANVLLEAGLGEDLVLLYRDDLSLCAFAWSDTDLALIEKLDMLILARDDYETRCIEDTLATVQAMDLPFFAIGIKHFGTNINPLLRLSPTGRAAARLAVPEDVRARNETWKARMAPVYLDVLAILSDDGGGTIRAADDDGVFLTTDRIHLSKAGAAFVAERLPTLIPGILALAGRNAAQDAGL